VISFILRAEIGQFDVCFLFFSLSLSSLHCQLFSLSTNKPSKIGQIDVYIKSDDDRSLPALINSVRAFYFILYYYFFLLSLFPFLFLCYLFVVHLAFRLHRKKIKFVSNFEKDYLLKLYYKKKNNENEKDKKKEILKIKLSIFG